MKLVSWNINGIRTLPQYHPWNSIKTCSGILKELGGDIICFQEVKLTRTQLTREIAVPDPYDAFFSFPTNKGGYSGVAVFNNPATTPATKAEEGLSGLLGSKLKPPHSPEERVSSYSKYPVAHDFNFMPDEDGEVPSDFTELESEGRALVVDFGRFVLINTYCPNEGSDERLPYKMNYHRLLADRVRLLIQEGREVIVVGDINVCAAPIDHVEGDMGNNAAEFWDRPPRAWFKEWIGPDGPMVDVMRKQWPERKGMYTCWNTRISARDSNYGTRIDYVLLTRGLLPWFKFGDIQPLVRGSDHCPIYIELRDKIVSPSTGEPMHLFEPDHFISAEVSPRICAKNWPEFSKAQKLLSTFFGKKALEAADTSPPSLESASPIATEPIANQTEFIGITGLEPSPSNPPSNLPPNQTNGSGKSSNGLKRKRDAEEESSKAPPVATRRGTSSKPNPRAGQASINAFFQPPGGEKKIKPTKSSKSKTSKFASQTSVTSAIQSQTPTPTPPDLQEEPDLEADLELARRLAEEDALEGSARPADLEHKKSWSKLFVKYDPPKCEVHNEPCKELATTKPGPNKGRYFWICSRPVGPGYDAGKARRLREDVDPQYRCNFFKWSSDAKKSAAKTTRGAEEPP